MENDEKQQTLERNEAICAYYVEGHRITECSAQFDLKRQRILQILKKAGVWVPYRQHGNPKQFLGVMVSAPTKEALKEEADRRGISVSKLTNEAIDAELLKEHDHADDCQGTDRRAEDV